MPTPGSRQAQGCGDAVGVEQLRARRAARRIGAQRLEQRRGGARPQLGVLVEQQAEVAARRLEQGGVVRRLARSALARASAAAARRGRSGGVPRLDRVGRAVVGGVVEHEDLVLEIGRRVVADRSLGRRAEAPARWCSRRSRTRSIGTIVLDAGPDRRSPGLHAALRPRPVRGAGARRAPTVELVTSRFPYGPVPRGEGYRGDELFYRRSTARGLEAPARRGPAARRARARDAPHAHPRRAPPTSSTTSG